MAKSDGGGTHPSISESTSNESLEVGKIRHTILRFFFGFGYGDTIQDWVIAINENVTITKPRVQKGQMLIGNKSTKIPGIHC